MMIGRWTRCTTAVVALSGLDLVGGAKPIAAASDWDRRIAKIFRAIPDPSVAWGVVVVDLSTDSVAFEHNAHQPLIPASNQKLLVMAAAVDMLGSGFEFRTVVGIRGRDLVIVGDGDPAIGDARLCERSGESATAVFDRWAAALKSTGHQTIEGDLIIDESVFDGQTTHPSWDESELQKWYASPTGGLNFADNCVELTVWPAAPGRPPLWEVLPPVSTIEVTNRATSARAGVPVVGRPSASFGYLLSGRCGSRVTLEPVSVPDPGMFFADACRTALERVGIVIRGRVRRERVRSASGVLPPDVTPIADYRTPIGDVLGRIGKNSQNLFAECLTKRLGYEHMRRRAPASARGSWVSAAAAINAFLVSCDIDTAGCVIADASGLSRENRVTASQFVRILTHMNKHPDRALFIDNLAVAGESGSLRDRMEALGGSVVAKTGTLRGVTALSGYIGGAANPRFAFSVIFNGIQGPTTPYRALQDELCRTLVARTALADK